MCGIAGIVGRLDHSSQSVVAGMLDAMVHRGPDQEGLSVYAEAPQGAVFGHRRLSIIDLSEAGRQPMTHQASGVSIVFNGECYNYLELRRELEQAGHAFVSNSDTEVVLAAFVEWGEAAIQRFRGMFAIALWDPRSRTALLVRDRLGNKSCAHVTAVYRAQKAT